MNEQPPSSIAELLADDALINEAIARAVREAVLKHARAGQPVATWQNGQVIWIEPDEILSHLANGSTA
jgi:hypothetical protein